MRRYNGKEISVKYYGKKLIIETRLGLRLIWQAIRSCFGNGFWRGDKPWSGDDAWKG